MPRPSSYSDEQKTAILEAVKAARHDGANWDAALRAAQLAGYKGKVHYLMKLVRIRKHPKTANASKSAVVGRKRGRPAGSGKTRGRPVGTGKKLGRPAVSRELAGMGDIESIVHAEVSKRLAIAKAAAIAAFEKALA